MPRVLSPAKSCGGTTSSGPVPNNQACIPPATLAATTSGTSARAENSNRNDVTIAAVSHTGDEAEPYVEAVSLKFAQVEFHYRTHRTDGSLDPGEHFKFDLKANKVG